MMGNGLLRIIFGSRNVGYRLKRVKTSNALGAPSFVRVIRVGKSGRVRQTDSFRPKCFMGQVYDLEVKKESRPKRAGTIGQQVL